MAWFIPALMAFVLAGACVSWWVADHRWKEMRARAPGQAAWLAMFGSEDAAEVEAILRKVAGMFHMRRRDTIFLRPEDTLGDLCRLSTGSGQIDSLEWVFLSKWLDAEYPTVREGLSAERTLRELVQACVARSPDALEATAHRIVRIARLRRGASRRFFDATTAFSGSQVRFRRVLGIREDPLLAFQE